MAAKFGKLSGAVTRQPFTSCRGEESAREMSRMAQALCRRRLKIGPLVYALSTLQPKCRIFSHIRKISGKLRSLSQAAVCPTLKLPVPLCAVRLKHTCHRLDGTEGRKGRKFHCACVGWVFFPSLHLASSPIFPVSFPLYIHSLMKQNLYKNSKEKA